MAEQSLNFYDPAVFAEHLRKLRKEANLTPRQVAQQLGISWREYVMIDKGWFKAISWGVLDALVDAIPKLSLATAPGVHPPPVRKGDLTDEVKGRHEDEQGRPRRGWLSKWRK